MHYPDYILLVRFVHQRIIGVQENNKIVIFFLIDTVHVNKYLTDRV